MTFHGKLITLPEYADISPVEVWHRQLEKREIVSKMEQNLHVLFRHSHHQNLICFHTQNI